MPRTRRAALTLCAALLAACGAVDADEAARIVEVLALQPGMTVADVGAGDGEWTLAMADAVGPQGMVIATEVEEDLVGELRELGLDNFRSNITAVLGDDRETGLGTDCCDAILLRMVYHHFTDPPRMRRSLRSALRPGGRLALIDIVPQQGWSEVEGVPDRGGHGIEIEDVVAEMLGAGFEVESIHPTGEAATRTVSASSSRRQQPPSQLLDELGRQRRGDAADIALRVELDDVGADQTRQAPDDLQHLAAGQAARFEVRHARREGRIQDVEVERQVDGRLQIERRDVQPTPARDDLDAEALGLLSLVLVGGSDADLHQAIDQTLLHHSREGAGV